MLHIGHIISGDIWAGAEAQAFIVIKALNQAPDTSIVVILLNKGVLYEKLIRLGIKVHFVPEESNSKFKLLYKIYKYLVIDHLDVVHFHGYKETFFGGIAARCAGIKGMVRTVHGIGMLEASNSHRLLEWINKRFFTNRLIAVSYDLSNFLIKKKGIKPELIRVIHNGLPRKETHYIVDSVNLRQELKIRKKYFVIGTLGRMVPVKGHKYFIEGASLVLQKHKDVIFLIGGNGPLKDSLQTLVDEYGISEHFKFTGYTKDPYSFINMLDVFVLTSIHEGIPMVILEAMSLAKAIVATKVGGVPEILQDRTNALLIPSQDPKAFSYACMELLLDDDLRKLLSRNAYSDFIEHYTMDNPLLKLQEVYESVSH